MGMFDYIHIKVLMKPSIVGDRSDQTSFSVLWYLRHAYFCTDLRINSKVGSLPYIPMGMFDNVHSKVLMKPSISEKGNINGR